MQEESSTHEPLVVFAPLSELTLKEGVKEDAVAPLVKEGLLFTKMESEVRRRLLNVAKSADASDDVLAVLLEAELVFWASVPRPLPRVLEGTPPMAAILYSLVAGAILNRIYNCLRIFQLNSLVPSGPCWFSASGPLGQIELETAAIQDPQWKAVRRPSYGPWDSRSRKADIGIEGLGLMWDRLTPLLKVVKLKSVFCDEAKWEGYFSAAEAFAQRKAEEFAAIRSEETGEQVEAQLEGQEYEEWKIEGAINAFGQAVRKLDFDLEQGPRGRRLIRAIQFLADSAVLPYPHRFIAVITSLEALLSKESAEVSHQLAARAAWFLHPDDPSKRVETYDEVISLYRLRSDIVHGRVCSIHNMTDQILRSEGVIRVVLLKILSNDRLLGLILDKDPNAYDKHLARLGLGQTGPAT